MKTSMTLIERLKATGYSQEELWAHLHNKELQRRLQSQPTSSNHHSHHEFGGSGKKS